MEASGTCVLVVDDDPGARWTFERVLKLEGFMPITAETGSQALDILVSRDDVQFVLTDLRMPGINGLELLAAVRELRPDMPVMLFSAFPEHWSQTAAHNLGAIGFVSKDSVEVTDALLKYFASASWAPRPSEPVGNIPRPGPAATRWVKIVAAGVCANEDLPTVAKWATNLGIAVATIKRWCALCGVQAADSLDFARALRVVIISHGHRCDWYNLLDIAEPKTLRSFRKRADLSADEPPPSPDEYIRRQQFIRNQMLLDAITAELWRRNYIAHK